MPSKRISFSNFNRSLVLAGGREQGGPLAVRRASGVAPERTTSVLSRWGSSLLWNINAIQLYYWNGVRYAYDGSSLYANGVSIQSAINAATGASGFNGGRLTFNSMPPQVGLNDYLFILGGGVTPFKIDPSGNVTLWGIVAPGNSMQANNIANDQIVIDSFNGNANGWVTVANVSSIKSSTNVPGQGGQSNSMVLEVTTGVPQAGEIKRSGAGFPLNLGTYSNGDISLQTDIFQFWFLVDSSGTNPFSASWIDLAFDVNDGTFKKDYYHLTVALVSLGSTNPHTDHAAQVTIAIQPEEWTQITLAKSQFIRVGNELQFDWTNVVAMRIRTGHFNGNDPYFYQLNLLGGSAMGAGPAAGNGGSEYDYFAVFKNLTTGSQSNPQPVASRVFDVSVNKVALSQIPVSTDAQVGARDLYRTTALNQPGGGIAFYLDTIYDNTTTTYTDQFSDFSVRQATTPWQKSVNVPPNGAAPYYIDAGNGYYFLLTTAGLTNSTPPTWKIPTTFWTPISAFIVGETIAPLAAKGQWYQVTTAGMSGLVTPNFGSLAATITDGTVVWTLIGLQTTTDNTAVWTFQGINSTPTITDLQMLLDNAPPQITYGDAFGPFQGGMFWCRDSAAGAQGRVYASPPGRPESVGMEFLMGTTNDPTQKLIEWDGYLWLATDEKFGIISGTYPQLTFQPTLGAHGTMLPYTIVRVQTLGLMYWAADGIRLLNWGGSRLIGFDQLAPIFRGQFAEDISIPWSFLNPPIWAARIKDEVIFSNNVLTLAFAYDGVPDGQLAWRLPGPAMTAAYHNEVTGDIMASFGGNTYLYEQPGQLSDAGMAIGFELQSAADMPDVGAEFTTQRLYITANLQLTPNQFNVAGATTPQVLTPTLIVDGTELPLPPITGSGTPNSRQTFELSPKMHGRFFDGVRLTGNLTTRIEVFRIEADVWLGEQNMP